MNNMIRTYVALMTVFVSAATLEADQKTDQIVWRVGKELRLHITYVDNSYSVTWDGEQVLTGAGNGDADGIFRIDVKLTPGEHTLDFRGFNAPSAPQQHDPNPYRFDVALEDQAPGGPWSIVKRYNMNSGGNTAPPGEVCSLTIKVTGVNAH